MLRRVGQRVGRMLFFAVIGFFVNGNAPIPGAFDTQIERIVGGDQFGFVQWEVEALAEKSAVSSLSIQDFLDDRQRAQVVVDYLDRLRHLFAVSRDLDQIYADPNVGDPDAASAALRAERDQIRSEVDQWRPLAEAILQDQIAAVLSDEGLSIGGRVFPPVLARVTPLPHILILSPRDEIKREPGIGLSADITVDRAEAIEDRIFRQLDKSALVTPIGGLALYPTMIEETSNLLWLLQVVAHEWAHNWLALRPLGFNLLLAEVRGGDLTTMNETVASLVGDEIGSLTLKRFYPELARRDYPQVYEPPKPVDSSEVAPPKPDPNAFSFGRAMRETRVQVDEYLAQAHELNLKAEEAERAGRDEEAGSLRGEALAWIVKAETYMEERRKAFWEQGYTIRKLNQAYFAFYGSYADQPGASGGDPVGPTVVELRHKSSSLREFLDVVSAVVSFDDLKRALARYQ